MDRLRLTQTVGDAGEKRKGRFQLRVVKTGRPMK